MMVLFIYLIISLIFFIILYAIAYTSTVGELDNIREKFSLFCFCFLFAFGWIITIPLMIISYFFK